MRSPGGGALLIFIVAAACGAPGTSGPRTPAPNARLSVGPDVFVDEGPFRVVFAGPKGDVESAHEVTIAFSRPIHGIGTLEDGIAAATVTRASDGLVIPGAWRWFGERTAVFWPKGDGLANATEYEVTINPSLRSYDDATLGATAPFRFASRRPKVARADHQWDEEKDVHSITLELNQMVPHESVRSAIKIEGKGPKGVVVVPFTIGQTVAQKSFELTVDRSIVSLEDVNVVVAPTLASMEGPLTSGAEQRVPLPDLGPQKIELSCTEPGANEEKTGAKRCSLESGGVRITFSKPVRGKDLARSLKFDNPKPKEDAEPLTNDPVYDLDLDRILALGPGKKYKVTVKAGLASTDKDRLAADRTFEFETVDYASRIHYRDIDGDGVVESARPEVLLWLDTMNVPSFEAVRAPLDEKQLFALLKGERTVDSITSLPKAITTNESTKGKKNEHTTASFDLPLALRPAGASGLFAVGTRAPGVKDEVRILSVTDLGITTKWSPHGGLVWVTHLSDGKPVQNAKVRVMRRGSEAATMTTDAEGIASIPAQLAATFLDPTSDPTLLVSSENDVAFARLPALDPKLSRAIGGVFMERRLYRPGETAYVKGLFRAPSAQGLVPLPGRKVQVEALDDEERSLFSTTAELDAFGGFSCEMPIPRNARLGFAYLRARLGTEPLGPKPRTRSFRYLSDWHATTRFTIDEFRTVEMKLEATAEKKEYVTGARADVTFSGRYLFGAPMHDTPVMVQASRQPTSFQPKDFDDFSTHDAGLWHSPRGVFMPEKKLALDSDGVGRLSLPLVLPNQNGPELVSVDASIEDVSKAFIVGDRTSFVVHPAEIYVGVRRGDAKTRPWIGKPVRAEVIAGAIDGTRRANVPVRLELFHRKAPNQEPISTGRTCNVVTTDKVASCELPVNEPGTYWISARANDAQGRPTASAISFDVQKEEPPKPKPPPTPVVPPKPELPPMTFDEACTSAKPRTSHSGALWVDREDDKEYAVGERVHACFRGGGLALFTQEREGVLSYELRRLPSPGVTRDLPIVPLHHPNVHLALHSVSGRTSPFLTKNAKWSSGSGHPSFDNASREVRVARPAEKALKVTIEAGEEHRPGEQIDATVRVVDGKGRPAVAQVTFWAVDQGVLELEPYHAPEPQDAFGETRRSDVLTNDTRSLLLWEKWGMHRTKAPSIRMGATSVSPQSHVGRTIFRPTAWFLPSLVTGPDGSAKARVKLPDNLTTWKLFAVAATATEAFGNAEAAFVTKKPLIARPALPRFLRAGDRFDAMAVIDSMEKRPLEVKVQMHATGATVGERTLTVAVPSEGHVPVTFPVNAPASGRGRISFRADSSGGLSDDVTIEEEVSTPTTMETIVLGGETRSRIDEPLGDLSRARTDVGGLDYRLSSTPLIGMAESIQRLIEYPYGCTEQLSSRLVPLVRLRSMARDLGVALPRDIDNAVKSALASLLSHQRSDGGFGFWQESAKSEPWLTVIALSALHNSKEAGYAVPGDAIDRAVTSVEKIDELDNASKAMLEDLFASLGKPRPEALRALSAEADKLPLFARALLAHALAKTDRPQAQRILDGVASQAKLTATTATIADEPTLPWRMYLSSDTRTTAMTLRAFVAVDPKNPLTAKLARGLLALRRKGRWPTTQESAWAIVALDDARALYPAPASPATFRVALDGAEAARTTGAMASTGTIPLAKLVAGAGGLLSFSAEGSPLFYEGALRYARKEAPTTPLEHGIHVARTLKTVNRDLRVGDYVEVEVVLASPVARELVVLDDPIPAGFEAVNERFANSDRLAPSRTSWEVTHREMRDDRVVSFFDRLQSGMTRTKYRLRVIASGRFVHPPAKAECMYAPDVFGRTASTTVETR